MARGGRVIYKKSNRRRRKRDDDDEESDADEEYVLGEDEEDDESNYELDKAEFSDDDEESYEFSEDEIEIARPKKRKQQRGRSKDSDSDSDGDEDFSPGDDDDEDLDEDENLGKKRKAKGSRSRKKKAVALPTRKRSKREIEDSDCDFVVKDRVSVRRKRSNSSGTARRKKPSVVSDSVREFEMSDDDFVEKSLVLIDRKEVKRTVRSKGRGKKRSEASDSDYVASDDLDGDFDVKDRNFVDKRKKKSRQNKAVGSNKRSRKRSVEVGVSPDFNYLIDEGDEDDVSVDRKPKKTSKKKTKPKTRRKRLSEDSASSDFDYLVDEDEDEDEDGEFVVEDEVSKKKTTNTKKRMKPTMRKKRSSEDSASSDFDYLVDEDEVDEDDDGDYAVEDEVTKMKTKNIRKKRTNRKTGRKRPAEDSASSDFDYLVDEDEEEDGDFILEDKVVANKKLKKTKKSEKKRTGPKRRRKRSAEDSGSSDFDYLVDEDDEFLMEDEVSVKKAKKKRIEPKTGRKGSRLVVDSDLDSLDYDQEISDEEIRDLRIGWAPEPQPLKRLVVGNKEAVKGKEKKTDDLGKQLCGICLSEEQKGVVQGLLNCCSHYFCFACIMEWSKVESRCPVCKRRFVTITKSGRSDPGFGMRDAVIRVQKRDQVYQPSEEELRGLLDPYENVVCMECQQGGDDNLMLLCDICDSSAHTFCVGLGREVPEGNWYCECCRSVNEGLSHAEAQVTTADQGASNSNMHPGVSNGGSFTNAAYTNPPLSVSVPGRPSSLRIDLNASPRDFLGDDHSVASPMSGSGASTVFGRRHIHQRIRILLSSSRHRQTSVGSSMLRPNSEAAAVHTEDARNGEAFPVSEGLNALPSVLPFEEWLQSRRPSFGSNSSRAPCTYNEGSSFRRVDGAKEEVMPLVKRHLKHLSRDKALDRTTLREIAKNSTHTILAACGIEHKRSNVTIAVELPDNCEHDSDGGPTHLVKNCCSSCFNSFIKDVVQRLIYTYS